MSAGCKPSRAAPPPPVPSHTGNYRQRNHLHQPRLLQKNNDGSNNNNNNSIHINNNQKINANNNNSSKHNGDSNNNNNSNNRADTIVGKIPTVIRPKLVETPTKKAPPRPPPPRMDYVPTRTSSLSKGCAAPSDHKQIPSKGSGSAFHSKSLHINTAKALRRVKIFGKSSGSGGAGSKCSTSNANGEFLTSGGLIGGSASSVGGRAGSSGLQACSAYTNQALSQPPRGNGKKQAPLPPRGASSTLIGTGAVATGTLISFDSTPSPPSPLPSSHTPPPLRSSSSSSPAASSASFPSAILLPPAPHHHHHPNRSHAPNNNVQSLLDMDFPEPGGVSDGMCLLDMDIPPILSAMSTSMSVDNFGSTPFDPFAPQPSRPGAASPIAVINNQRKGSLPAVSSMGGLAQPLIPLSRSTTTTTRVSQIREENSSCITGSPPPPKGPAPQLNPLDTSSSALHPNPCGMALADHPNPAPGELAYSQYDIIELISNHDYRFYMCRLDEQEGLVRKDALEVLTPLDDSQQDSEPECLQDPWNNVNSGGSSNSSSRLSKPNSRPESSTSQNDDKPEPERFHPRDSAFINSSSSSTSAAQLVWPSTKPVASVSPLPPVSSSTSSSAGAALGFTTGHGSAPGHLDSSAKAPGTATTTTTSNDWAIALFDFEAQHDDELGFVAGEKLLVDSRVDQDWLYGCSVKGARYGLFPAAFVQLKSDNDDSETESVRGAEIVNTKVSTAAAVASELAGAVENGKSDSNDKSHDEACDSEGRPAVALYSFVAEQDGDLGFEEGETVWVMSRLNKDWLYGRNGSGQEGQFPASFVIPEGQGNGIASDSSEGHKGLETSETAQGHVFVCMYDFEAQQENDLTIHVNDKIQVTKMVSDEWWQGRILGGSTEGIFPANFVRPL